MVVVSGGRGDDVSYILCEGRGGGRAGQVLVVVSCLFVLGPPATPVITSNCPH